MKTPKEALKGMCDLSKVKYDDYGLWVELKGAVEHALNELEIIKSYPTVDEVCSELSEHIEHSVYYANDKFKVHGDVYGEIVDLNSLPPHLITLIGRFYEGLEKGEGK